MWNAPYVPPPYVLNLNHEISVVIRVKRSRCQLFHCTNVLHDSPDVWRLSVVVVWITTFQKWSCWVKFNLLALKRSVRTWQLRAFCNVSKFNMGCEAAVGVLLSIILFEVVIPHPPRSLLGLRTVNMTPNPTLRRHLRSTHLCVTKINYLGCQVIQKATW